MNGVGDMPPAMSQSLSGMSGGDNMANIMSQSMQVTSGTAPNNLDIMTSSTSSLNMGRSGTCHYIQIVRGCTAGHLHALAHNIGHIVPTRHAREALRHGRGHVANPIHVACLTVCVIICNLGQGRHCPTCSGGRSLLQCHLWLYPASLHLQNLPGASNQFLIMRN